MTKCSNNNYVFVYAPANSTLVHRCDYIVAARRTSEHIVPSYFQITQNDKFDSNELIPF